MKRTRGMALLVVLWAIAIAVIVVASLQSTAFSQAAAGRESLARVRAYWAARAGLEATIARIEFDTQNPDPGNAFRELDDCADVAEGSFADTIYLVSHSGVKGDEPGPTDAHAKLNINRLTAPQLLNLTPIMTEDVADAILDWIDADDDMNLQGAEVSYYNSLPFPYSPRNAPMRSIQELELVANVFQEDVRGEDWNLNGILDPNEDDGKASLPNDNSDHKLDAGWSGVLTTDSVDGGLSPEGLAKLDLTTASESDIVKAVGVDSDQAKAIADYIAKNPTASLGIFLQTNLSQLARQGAQPGQQTTRVGNLTDDQLAKLFDETQVGAATGPQPGKLNVNTCEAETLQMIPDIDPTLADAIISERSGRPNGFASIIDLKQVPGMTRQALGQVYDLLCVRSNVFNVTVRGRDTRTGIEVEIVASIDRSTLPATVKGVRVR